MNQKKQTNRSAITKYPQRSRYEVGVKMEGVQSLLCTNPMMGG